VADGTEKGLEEDNDGDDATPDNANEAEEKILRIAFTYWKI